MRAVNLLPKDDVQRRRQAQNVPVLVAVLAVVIVAALLGVFFLMQSSKVKDKRAELALVTDQIAQLPPPDVARAPIVEQFVLQQQSRVAAVSSALQNRVAWDRVLREFALILPSDVWLTELTGQSPAPPGGTVAPSVPGTPSNQFVIRGYTYSHAAVARLLTRLSVIPDLRNVFLVRSTRLGRVTEFAIAAEVRTAGATS